MKTKTIHKPLLSGGLFDKPFMDSRATTQTVSTKEWVLGHLIGPLGLIFVVNTIAALVEKFFTQQTGAMYGVDNIAMIMKMGGVYEVVMTVAKILAMGTGLLNGWMIQHTQCRQGRIRDIPHGESPHRPCRTACSRLCSRCERRRQLLSVSSFSASPSFNSVISPVSVSRYNFSTCTAEPAEALSIPASAKM